LFPFFSSLNPFKGIIASEYIGYSGVIRIGSKYQDTYGYGFNIEKQTDYHYDVLGRLTSYVVSPNDLNLTTSYGYDAVGNRTSITDPKGRIIYFDYNNANREIAEYFAVNGTEPNVKKEIFYYENGLVKDVNSYDYDGTLLAHGKYEYDARRRLKKATQDIDDINEAVTFYDYNDAGFIYDANRFQIRITDAENKVTFIKLDEFGNKCRRVYPSGDYEQLEYNPDRTLKKKAVWDANDVKLWIEYFYDDYARLIDVNYPDGGNAHYTYDGFGRKIQTTDSRNSQDRIGGSNTIIYDYDVLNRLSQTTEQDDYRIEYTYQADGQKQTLKVHAPNDALVYHVEYWYDSASRMQVVTEPVLGGNDLIAWFDYDKNGNRKKLEYYRTGSPIGPQTYVNYTYDFDNHLKSYTTGGGPTFSFDATNASDIDGLGRLLHADETITNTDGGTVDHSYTYQYDMLSRIRYAYQSNVAPTPAREYSYDYDNAGNMTRSIFNNYSPNQQHYTWYSYDADNRTGANNDSGWSGTCYFDENGRQTSLLQSNPQYYPVEYDWDGRIRKNQYLNPSMGSEAKYTPEGVRIYKELIWNLASYEDKYIVDTSGELPNILLAIDVNDGNHPIVKTYIYANGQVIMQHDGSFSTPKYFYLHDRLGSVRQIMNSSASVKNCYFYTPWGGITGTESYENIDNWHTWAGYFYEDAMEGYYCNARNYYSGRFMTRDPVAGSFTEPMTLHAYLYCLNDPINNTDPSGEFLDFLLTSSVVAKMRAKIAAFGAAVMSRAQSLYYAAAERAARINIWMQEIFYGQGGGYSDPKTSFSQGQLANFERILEKDGINALLKSRESLVKLLYEHSTKLGDLQYKSSVEREILNFEQQIAAIDYLLEKLKG
jgi:RHS repeat-associated protein